jgi:hypothetical protein
MGYDTYYKLGWGRLGDDGSYYNVVDGDVEEKIKDYINNNEDIMYAIGEDAQGGDSCKWYEHEEDMLKMSSNFHGIVFILEGEGEEAGDIWKKYFLNGMVQECKAIITYEPFDLSKFTPTQQKLEDL